MSTAWLDFYRGKSTDSEGRYIHEILAWNDKQLEGVHDYIQWLFPLPDPSMFNARAPILTRGDIAVARADETIQANLRAAFERMLRFYGLTAETADRPKPWVCAADHNHLRLTRIFRSLRLLGLFAEAQILFDAISEYDTAFPERTKQFWRDAMTLD
ncbi:MAG: opioid growth factor receptor-related protein [Bryobacteraceae bacterium]